MRKPNVIFFLAVALVLTTAVSPAQTGGPVFHDLPGPGKTCRIGEEYAFTYEFNKPPKMGMAIVKIQLFDGAGKRTTELEITGRVDMPAMRGAHDTGEAAFKLNKKGDYLLPVNIVMPGDWEVRLAFSNSKDIIYRGVFKFNV